MSVVNILEMPEPVIDNVIGHLQGIDLVGFSLTCKTFRKCVLDIWEPIIRERIPQILKFAGVNAALELFQQCLCSPEEETVVARLAPSSCDSTLEILSYYKAHIAMLVHDQLVWGALDASVGTSIRLFYGVTGDAARSAAFMQQHDGRSVQQIVRRLELHARFGCVPGSLDSLLQPVLQRLVPGAYQISFSREWRWSAKMTTVGFPFIVLGIEQQLANDRVAELYTTSAEFTIIATQWPVVRSTRAVERYSMLIQAGVRPFIVVLGYGDVWFLLDGHHKLEAYSQLDITPAVVTIAPLLPRAFTAADIPDNVHYYGTGPRSGHISYRDPESGAFDILGSRLQKERK